MIIIIVSLAVLLILSLLIHVLLIRTGTQIGEKGRRNVLLQNLFCIVESVIIMILSLMWARNSAPNSIFYALGAAAIGFVLLISGIIGLRGVLRESPDDLVTETLLGIRVEPAGYHNQDRKLEGMANGKNSWFMLRGGDKALAEQIKRSGFSQVTVVYHSSNRRIESIQS